MRRITSILVDDERLARANLRALLADHPEVEIVGEAANAAQAYDQIKAQQPDLVFLDIQMPRGSGFDVLKALDDPPAVIFVTAHDRYAIRAFEVNALDYLLKPVEPSRLASAIDRLSADGDGQQHRPALSSFSLDDMVWVKTANKGFFLPVVNIAMLRAAGNYSYLMCEQDSEYLVRRPLVEWERALPGDRFVTLDRSHIINWQHVQRWETAGRKLQLYIGQTQSPLTLGRSAAHRFKKEAVPRIESYVEG